MAAEWQPELRTLRYFVCVAEEKSLTKAATRLHIAQPALSRQIRGLELDLGLDLFLRTSRGVELTEAGGILLRRAYVILNQIQQTHHDVTAHATSPRGVVTIGMPPTPGEFIGPPLLARMKERFPEIELRFLEGFSGELERRINNNEISLAVMHDPAPRENIKVTPMLVEPLCVVGPPGSLTQAAYDFADAVRLPLILPSRPNFLRILIDDQAQRFGLAINDVQRSDGVWHLKSLVRFGHGYTILTYGAVLSEVQQGTLEAAPIRNPQIDWTLCVAMRTDQGQKQALTVVEEEVRDIVAGLVERGIWR
ncbi:LysR family transcriptional regulator [Jiella mangrovi]|uniref:LysR family transcriptional regulator n=1 Tax=Jiella mangrovi TaxID=2821407 RepID=A0ABS4BJD4_9HYPH|nr:LysR family transcriptional regulator [Jiella mangrovi]MBP0616878.1 LysR family transcriptional regulator [Jiella mangrovi]